MEFRRVNGADPEKVFVALKNTSGGTMSAGVPVFYETDAVSDGLAVSQAVANQTALFAGITDKAMVDDATGLVQVYGVRDSAWVSAASAGNGVGLNLIAVAGQDYLTNGTAGEVAGDNFVHLFETVAASAGFSSVRQWKVFIRAL